MRKLPDTTALLDPQSQGVGRSTPHESARMHVTGQARYVDDYPEPSRLLHAAVGGATLSAGQLLECDLSEVIASEGVKAVLQFSDLTALTDVGPVFPGDPLLLDREVKFHGQPVFVVAADSLEQARKAVKKAKMTFEEQAPQLDPHQSLESKRFVRPPHRQSRGDAESAIANSAVQLSGALEIGGQEHFYLEGQVSMAVPDDGGMMIYCSTQHPSEVQKLVAEVLGKPLNSVTVDMRRMGGGFGGKETQAAPWACLAALLAEKTATAVKLRLPRADDMRMTGKRHPFFNRYRLGADEKGMLQGYQLEVVGNCGHSADLSDAIVDRAMFHADNAYYLGNAQIDGFRCFTNTVSHTAFRGFGGPQGMMSIEGAMDDLARAVGRDPLDIRKQNLYREGADETHYYQKVTPLQLGGLIEQLEQSSDYRQRREEIKTFNQNNRIMKRGLALTPVKFGISFTVQHLNQAGALIHLYTDGSIQINHGGSEMGQGLHTKICQVVSEVLQVDLSKIRVTSTRTDKVPNSSPTAASSGSDLNGQAAANAAMKIKKRLMEFLSETHQVAEDQLAFTFEGIKVGDQLFEFAEVVQRAYMARISLSATGFYKTPDIYYDRDKAAGQPFFYFANGAAVSEVLVDSLTGEYRVMRVDILHDVGHSLNPALDIGQIEGGFIQGMGWLTTEELVWDDQGRLRTDGPATYKIPTVADLPPVFNVNLLSHAPNQAETIFRSKAVGEPPFMLAISVWSALRDAISSLSDYKLSPSLNVPATPERVLMALKAMKQREG